MDTTLSKGRPIRKVTGDGGEFSSSMNFFSLMCPLIEFFFDDVYSGSTLHA